MAALVPAARRAAAAGGVLVGSTLLLSACFAADAPSPRRPDIVVLISDDQAHHTLGGSAPAWFRTPNLQRIASGGVRFTNAFVTTSLCSPSRASFLTGRWVRRHGIRDNRAPLPAEVPTFATQLAAAGYETAYFGKWHMGQQVERPGFQVSASYTGQGVYRNNPFLVNGTPTPTKGHVDDVTTEFALSFLEKRTGGARSRPFAMVVGFKSIHSPRRPAARFTGLYADASVPAPANAAALPPYPRHRTGGSMRRLEPGVEMMDDTLRRYYQLVAGIDENVGRLLDAIEKNGKENETLIVYTSDNGYLLGAHGMVSKRAAYEESIRVPLLLRYPALSAGGGRRLDALVLNVDLAPTLLDLAGVGVPEGMQGRSWRPLLEGSAGADWREHFVYEYYRDEGNAMPEHFALRTRDAKLIEYPGHPDWTELFDLRNDPGEIRNLAVEATAREQLAGMRARLVRAEEALGPRLH